VNQPWLNKNAAPTLKSESARRVVPLVLGCL
jgi:hypothetical protein